MTLLVVSNLVEALGKSHVDPAVVRLIAQLNLSGKRIKLKRGDFDVGFEAPEFGVDIVFSDPGAYLSANELQEGALVLSSVMFFGGERKGYRRFASELPAGLTFEQSRNSVRGQLGAPEFSSPIAPIDRWNWNGIKLAVTYLDDESSIYCVNCDLAQLTPQ